MALGGQQQIKTERYNAIRTNQSILGAVIPILFGQNRLSGRLIDYTDFTSSKAKTPGGSGLGKGGSQYVYSATVLVALAHGLVNYLLNVYDANGRYVLISASEPYTVGGGGTYTVANAAIYGNDQGVSVAQSYSVVANDYGSPGSQTYSGTQQVPMTRVTGTPATGQYSVNPSTGVYTFASADSGKAMSISYSYYRYILVTEELGIVPFSGPFTITVDNSVNFKSDQGVDYYPSGNALTRISSGTPTVGQYKVSGSGVYTFAAADTGQGVAISYEYNDPNTDNNAPNQLSLTLFNGAQGQSPWSYMTSKHPARALGYTELAYLASQNFYLGYTPELPQLSYECAGQFQVGGGILDTNPADDITALLTSSVYGIGFPAANLGSLLSARTCWQANSFFISPVIDNQSNCQSIIGDWLEAGMVGGFWSEGLLKFVPYGDTTAVGNGAIYSPSTQPVANLTDSDFVTKGAEDPIKVTRTPWQDAYNRVQIGYANRVNDYNPEICYEQDDASIARFGLRIEDPTQWDFITTQTAAQYAASMRVQRNVYIRNTYQFVLKSNRSQLEPMDVVTLTDTILGLNLTPVRITKIEDDPVDGLTVTAEDFLWGTAQPAFNPKATNSPYIPDNGYADPGDTSAIVFEAPDPYAKQRGNILYGFCAGANANWGGCHVWVSFDGTNYNQFATVNSPGRTGVLASSLPLFSGSNPDTSDTLVVNLNQPGDSLQSTTSAGAAVGVTLCAIVNPSNVVEFLSYQTSTLTGQQQYSLTNLWRGLYQSGAIAHSAGEFFARLDEASFEYQYDSAYYGKTIYFKFTSFNLYGNNEQSLANVTASSFVLQGIGPGAIDLETGIFRSGTGSVPNSWNGTIAYTSTTTSIDLTWSLTLTRGTMPLPGTDTIDQGGYAGAQNVTGLSPSTTYYAYGYIDDTNPASGIQFVGSSEVAGAVGTPAILYTTQNATATYFQARNDRLPVADAPMSTATPASGTGGGSTGGSGGTCLRGDMKVEHREDGIVPIATIVKGDWIRGDDKHEWVEVLHVHHELRKDWVEVACDNADSCIVTPMHPWPIWNDEAKIDYIGRGTETLMLEDILVKADGTPTAINSIARVTCQFVKVSLTVDSPTHCFAAGRRAPSLMCHNARPVIS